MGGTLAHADPAAELPAALLATLIAAAAPDGAVVSRTVLPFLRRRLHSGLRRGSRKLPFCLGG